MSGPTSGVAHCPRPQAAFGQALLPRVRTLTRLHPLGRGGDGEKDKERHRCNHFLVEGGSPPTCSSSVLSSQVSRLLASNFRLHRAPWQYEPGGRRGRKIRACAAPVTNPLNLPPLGDFKQPQTPSPLKGLIPIPLNPPPLGDFSPQTPLKGRSMSVVPRTLSVRLPPLNLLGGETYELRRKAMRDPGRITLGVWPVDRVTSPGRCHREPVFAARSPLLLTAPDSPLHRPTCTIHDLVAPCNPPGGGDDACWPAHAPHHQQPGRTSSLGPGVGRRGAWRPWQMIAEAIDLPIESGHEADKSIVAMKSGRGCVLGAWPQSRPRPVVLSLLLERLGVVRAGLLHDLFSERGHYIRSARHLTAGAPSPNTTKHHLRTRPWCWARYVVRVCSISLAPNTSSSVHRKGRP